MVQNFENTNFHEYDRRVGYVLARINPQKYERLVVRSRNKKTLPYNLTEGNIALLDKYYMDIVNEGLTKARILSVLDQTARLLEWLGKDWGDATIDDIKQLVNKVRNLAYGEHTKSDYLDKLKRFDKWMNDGEYSDKTRRIKTTMKSKFYKLPSQLITPEEALQIVNSAQNARDRALLHLLWETGARIGEIANLRIKDLEFDKGECLINLYGKTGSRRVLIIESVRDLQDYLKVRCAKSQEEFLFILIGTYNNGEPITYSAIQRMIERAIRNNNLQKHIHPHLFRHSRASYLASKGLAEAQLCMIFGWQVGSKQVRTYIHLSQSQVHTALMEKVYNIKKPEDQKIEYLKCPTCFEVNPATNNTCHHCYNPLTIQGALQLKQEKQLIEQDRDVSQKVFAEAFRLISTQKLTPEEAQTQAIKIIAQQQLTQKPPQT